MPATSAAVTPKPTAAPVAATAPVEGVPANGLHVVEPKEGLYAVARRYGLRPADLIAWNNLPQNPSLRIGQTLRVVAASPVTEAVPVSAPAKAMASTDTYQPKALTASASTTPATTPPASTSTAAVVPTAAPVLATVRHKVAAGESMYAISRKYGVTIKQIMEWNSKADFNVKPGEVLVVQPTK